MIPIQEPIPPDQRPQQDPHQVAGAVLRTGDVVPVGQRLDPVALIIVPVVGVKPAGHDRQQDCGGRLHVPPIVPHQRVDVPGSGVDEVEGVNAAGDQV